MSITEPTPAARPAALAALAVAGVATGLLACAGAWALTVPKPRDPAPAEREEALRKLREAREEDRKALAEYDLSGTPIRIPIERAMELIARENARPAPEAADEAKGVTDDPSRAR